MKSESIFKKIIKHALTVSLFLFGFILILIVLLENKGLQNLIVESLNIKIEHLIELRIEFGLTCLGLLCLVLGAERALDFIGIQKTIASQSSTIICLQESIENVTANFNRINSNFQMNSEKIDNLILEEGNLNNSVHDLIKKFDQPFVLQQIKWEDLISHSNIIDFVVQGWDGWIRDNAQSLTMFLKIRVSLIFI
ncbi:MAG: hypothetical protein IPJ79_01300 [Bacteroidetes bacterium]|nr:hypothetical protein [Bacteroidota bacterium]